MGNPKKQITNEQTWLYKTAQGNVGISNQKLYLYLKETLPIKITDTGSIYLYDKNQYRKLSVREFKHIIKSYMPPEIRNEKDWKAVFKEFATDKPDMLETDFNSDENIVGFENGVLHLDTMELTEHSEQYALSRIVPCKYLSGKTLSDAPVFEKYLRNLVSDNEEEIKFLLEYVGGVISNVYGFRFKKMLIMVGAGNTGKSQLRELIIQLVGAENCASVDLHKLQERFGTSQLYGKRFSGSGDMSNMEISELNIAKELTGGDALLAEYKGKDAFTFQYRGFLGFNANSLPYFRGDRGSHVYERFIIVKCHNVVPQNERDPHLLDKMLKERDVIASIAIDALKQAIVRGFQFSESDEMIKSRKEYQIANNSLLAFYNDCCKQDWNYQLKRSEFNKVYRAWCSVNQVKPERDREIPAILQEYFNIEAKKTRGEYYYPLKIAKSTMEELAVENTYKWQVPELFPVSDD